MSKKGKKSGSDKQLHKVLLATAIIKLLTQIAELIRQLLD